MSCFKLDTLENLEPKLTGLSKNSTSKKVRIVDFLTTKKGGENHYPFGMLMPNRNEGSSYRYGMNGMERDNEISGKGNSLTTPFRMYNPRLGRWMSTAPVTHPQYSPYSAFDNNPIYSSDPSGADSDTDPPASEVKPVKGDKKHTDGAGGRTLFLPEKAKLWGYVSDRKNKDGETYASKGDISSFEVKGSKYSAKFNEHNNFMGNQNSSGQYYQFRFQYGGKSYKANSLQTLIGRDDEYNHIGAFPDIRELTESDLERVIDHAAWIFYDANSKSFLEFTVKNESVGGMLDYEHSAYDILGIEKQMLIMIDGTVYNANEAGNFL